MICLNKISKGSITVILFLIFSEVSFAQKDTSVYYFTNSGRQVHAKDSAELFLFVVPPDTSVNKSVFIVKGFYPSGRLRLIAGSLTRTLPLKLQGYYVDYFPNGHRMQTRNFVNGAPVGDIIQYFPNGKFYNKRSYSEEISDQPGLLLVDCSDSTGKILTQNGNGNWIGYNSDFTKITARGNVRNGKKDSIWVQTLSDGREHTLNYINGKIIKPDGNSAVVEVVPGFPGGLEAFARFIGRTMVYPSRARSNNTQGRVIVSFVVERDGTLSEIKVTKGIGDGCDEEAVRMMKLSPKWKPGMQNGVPVRVAYSVPIDFTIRDQ
jgi:TonB family protein